MVWDDALSLSFAASQGHQHAMPPSSLRHRHSAVITPPSLLRHRVAAASCRAVAHMICDEPSQDSHNSTTRRRNAVANPRHLVTNYAAANLQHAVANLQHSQNCNIPSQIYNMPSQITNLHPCRRKFAASSAWAERGGWTLSGDVKGARSF